MKLTKPLLIGRGPWAQTIEKTLVSLQVPPVIILGSDRAEEYLDSRRSMENHDCIIIASAVKSHGGLLAQGRDAGLPVFVEKPLTRTLVEARLLSGLYGSTSAPPLLCDFTYCWSLGFEAMQKVAKLPFMVDAAFGGPIVHQDCHPVWDYGSHIVAMMLLLGVPVEDLMKLRLKVQGHKYTLSGFDYTLAIHSNIPNKLRRFNLIRLTGPTSSHKVEAARLSGTSWKVIDGEDRHFIDDAKEGPLTRALSSFLNLTVDHRWGLKLPVNVTRVLNSWVECC